MLLLGFCTFHLEAGVILACLFLRAHHNIRIRSLQINPVQMMIEGGFLR